MQRQQLKMTWKRFLPSARGERQVIAPVRLLLHRPQLSWQNFLPAASATSRRVLCSSSSSVPSKIHQVSQRTKRFFSGESAIAGAGMGCAVADLGNQLKFHHLHLYVNSLKSLEEYKAVEDKLNNFVSSVGNVEKFKKQTAVEKNEELEQLLRAMWREKYEPKAPDATKYVPHGQDVVKQMIMGAGWRIAGVHEGPESTSYHVATHENPREGVAVVVTAAHEKASSADSSGTVLDHFHPKNLNQYFEAHGFRQGCAVLAFHSNSVDKLAERYKETHPALVRAGFPKSYGRTKILEVYAYYQKDSTNKPDLGTVVRFVEEDPYREIFPLPGMQPVKYQLSDPEVCAAYPDHWVSNVFDREQVLKTFEDVFGFQPKVNFNAGVVGAGEAVIESTVTGNEPKVELSDENQWFKNQDQIYLPINNALSEHGHVHLYLEQVGQGVQHFASRVKNLPDFISRANRFREVTGEGLAFLDIPRSYYGFLRVEDFEQFKFDRAQGEKVLEVLRKENIVDEHNVVALDIDREGVERVLKEASASSIGDFIAENQHSDIADLVCRGRYRNLYDMMLDTLNEEEYLNIVKNKILVDIQGKDILLQIFSKPVLMAEPGQQAPFFEFIQRVCDKEKATLSPGCGGFGIRNFLTLFLSIEVSNFMDLYEKAVKEKDELGMKIAKQAVAIFTSQLHASNPVLTKISDALEKQTQCINALQEMDASSKDYEEKKKEIQFWEDEKNQIQDILKTIGEDHKQQMAALMATRKNGAEGGSKVGAAA
ncbi:unnamed protein product [Amoebophrya sp. A120]|nr:unnamed protein product [Amoebophrya sp. A120]|eukprot:GSA120T00005663001.1